MLKDPAAPHQLIAGLSKNIVALQNMLSSLDPHPAPNDPASEEILVSFLLAHPEQAGALLGQLGPEDFQGERARCTGKLQGMGIPIVWFNDLIGLQKSKIML